MNKSLVSLGLFLMLVVAPLAWFFSDEIAGASVVSQSLITVDSTSNDMPYAGTWLKVFFPASKVESYTRFDIASGSQVSDGSTVEDHIELYVNAYEPRRVLKFATKYSVMAKADINNKNTEYAMATRRDTASSWVTIVPYKISASKDSVMLGERIDVVADTSKVEGITKIADGLYIEKLGRTLTDNYPEAPHKDLDALGYKDITGSDKWSVYPHSDVVDYVNKWNAWVTGLKKDSECYWKGDSKEGTACEYYVINEPIGHGIGVPYVKDTNGYREFSCDLGKKDLWTKTFSSTHFVYGAKVMQVATPFWTDDLVRPCLLIDMSIDAISPLAGRADSYEYNFFKGSLAEDRHITNEQYTLTYPIDSLGYMSFVVWADSKIYPAVKEVIVDVRPRIARASLDSNVYDEGSTATLSIEVVNDGDGGDVSVRADLTGFDGRTGKKYVESGRSATFVLTGRVPLVSTDTNYCGVVIANAGYDVPSGQLCYVAKDVADEVPITTAPPPGELDTDGDGVPDNLDECPEEYGTQDHDGCPPPPTDTPSPSTPPPLVDDNGGEIPLAVVPFAIGGLALIAGLVADNGPGKKRRRKMPRRR